MADRPRATSRTAHWLRRAPSAPGPDFADLGTAFGLDQAMTPEAEEPAKPAAASGRGVSRWWRRSPGGSGRAPR